MTEALIANINKVVGQDDTLWHLGDWSFGGIESIWKFRSRIICKNIHLVYGNHDEHIEANKTLPNCHAVIREDDDGFKEVHADGPNPRTYKDDRDCMFDVYAQELFSSVQYYKELKLNGRRIILSHYAHRVWNKSHHGSYHLYGHSHGTIDLKPYGRSMDVGVDTHPEFRPYSLAEVVKILEKRDVLFVDHHSKETN